MDEPVSVREVMNREYIGASAADDLVETTELLVREGEPTALVLQGNDPVGVVTSDDVLRHVPQVFHRSQFESPPDERRYRVTSETAYEDADWDAVAAEGYDALPDNAKAYLDYISEELDTPIYAVGIGPGREQSVVRERPFE